MHPFDTTVFGNMDAEIGLLQGFTLTSKQSLRTDSTLEGQISLSNTISGSLLKIKMTPFQQA